MSEPAHDSPTEQEQQMTQTSDDTELLDEDWLAAPTRRSRWRTTLLCALAAAVVFLGGVEVQKQFGSSATAASGRPAGFAGGLGGGFAGGFPGATGGTGSTSTTTGGTAGSQSTSSVIGTVVSRHGTTWTIKDLGGTTHRVTVPATAPLTRQRPIKASRIKPGATVDVQGSTSGGRLTATSITLR
jgi:hypothetical protein